MTSNKQAELSRLSTQLDNLKQKYTYDVYSKLKLEPEDILQHVRECIRASTTHNLSRTEYESLLWRNPLHPNDWRNNYNKG